MTTVSLAETARLVEATSGTPTSRRFRARIIEGDRWGSSGYYSREVLERDGPATWPESTQVFFDHPTESERYERPERSVLDLAGRIASTPVYESDGLYADVEIYPHAAPAVEAMRNEIGLSIRASAEVEQGEAQGRTGTVITRLTEGVSVDLVTRAGAGGRLVSLLESARPEVVTERAVTRGVAEATANETREQLQQAIRDAYGTEDRWAWVRDFDDTTVWFDVDAGEDTGTFQQAYTTSDDTVALSGDRTEVRAETTYVPVNPAGRTTPATESREDTMPNVEEAELGHLREAAGRVTVLESERDTAIAERDTARTELAEARAVANTATADRVVREAAEAAQVDLNQWEVAGLTADMPLTESGTVDEAALRTRADEATAAIAEARGAGRVRNGGGFIPSGEVSEADVDQAIASAFGRTPVTTKEA